MNDKIVLNISLLLKGLESKMATFILPEPITDYLWKKTLEDMMRGIVHAAQNDYEIPFPSLDLVNLYGIEGPYRISFFSRALANFQRDVSEALVARDLLDKVVQGNYIEVKMVRELMMLSPSNVNIVKLVKIQDNAKQTYSFGEGHTGYEPSRVSEEAHCW